eukprot:sb/3476101/
MLQALFAAAAQTRGLQRIPRFLLALKILFQFLFFILRFAQLKLSVGARVIIFAAEAYLKCNARNITRDTDHQSAAISKRGKNLKIRSWMFSWNALQSPRLRCSICQDVFKTVNTFLSFVV